jgi:2-polyprenyl-6-methoxyphenol hydroxylase-like FAD-dependent oxidoreductase
MHITIIGAGIGGLTMALAAHHSGISCDVYESVPEIKPIGVGINILPHASRFLCESLGLEEELSKKGVLTKEAIFFNRFGQKIYAEPSGRSAGYAWPQFSIHRGDLQMVLLDAFLQRVGKDHLHLGMDCTRVDEAKGIAYFKKARSDDATETTVQADAVIACDGVHSIIRKQLHPNEGKPLYSGVNMWRGVTVWKPFLSEASMVRAGWLTQGKMVIYPIRNNVDGQGSQLINWVAELETPNHLERDWNKQGRLEDFIGAFEDWHFDWLDVPALIRGAQSILEFPMIDQDPLPFWSRGKVTLLGDAAHPMYPRGSNGAGQSILDAQSLAMFLTQERDTETALKKYEDIRLEATGNVVRMNRINPPDAILREVWERSEDKPFHQIEDIISHEEMEAITQRYKTVAGYDKKTVAAN